MVRIGINGLGRIGRTLLRVQQSNPEWADCVIVAVNDPAPADLLIHLLQYDSTHGTFKGSLVRTEHGFLWQGREVLLTSAATPAEIPWRAMGVDYVLEVSGRFTGQQEALTHLHADGAQRVIIGAPASSGSVRTLVMGINEQDYQPALDHVVSNASCTTNCLAPVAHVLLRHFGIRQGLITTVHSYTNDQRLLDTPHHDWRRARAASQSMIPTKTGAAQAIGLVIPELQGRLDGLSIRVPTPDVSLLDAVFELERTTSAEEVNQVMRAACNRYLGYTETPLVSVDFIGNSHSAIVDGGATRVIGTTAKVCAWYDNEWGYANRLFDLVRYMADRGPC
ncbi:MAG: type I glyceraldehyde-3-phosphate dehydrogenase [Magnetococcales bacterium]|nr:type I glyceraldehyde-3-phosphate dehydrogenase [Magnetococcales bacterium]